MMQIDFEDEYSKHCILATWNWSGNEDNLDPAGDIYYIMRCQYSGDEPLCIYLNLNTHRRLYALGADRKTFRHHIERLIENYGNKVDAIRITESIPDNRVLMRFKDGSMVGLNTEPHITTIQK